jgi:hypothetical protein
MAEDPSRPLAAGYRGQSIAPVPSGYIEAYAQAGRSYAALGESVGKNIGDIMESHRKNNLETEAVDGTWTAKFGDFANYVEARDGKNSKSYDELLKHSQDWSTYALSKKKGLLGAYDSAWTHAAVNQSISNIRADRVRTELNSATPNELGGKAFMDAMAQQTVNVGTASISSDTDYKRLQVTYRQQFNEAKAQGLPTELIEQNMKDADEAYKQWSTKFRATSSFNAAALTKADEDAAKDKAAPYGLRQNGTPKGKGWLGELKMTDGSGRVMTENTIHVSGIGEAGIDPVTRKPTGQGIEIPTLIPTLTVSEKEFLASGGNVLDGSATAQAIVIKAKKHASELLKQGKDVFSPIETKLAKVSPEYSSGVQSYAIEKKDTESKYKIIREIYKKFSRSESDRYSGTPDEIISDVVEELGIEPLNKNPKLGSTAVYDNLVSSLKEVQNSKDNKELESKFVSLYESTVKEQNDNKVNGKFGPDAANAAGLAAEKAAGVKKEEPTKPSALLSTAVQNAIGELNSGRSVDVRLDRRDGQLSPIVRVLAYHSPEVIKPNGEVDVTAATRILGETLNAKAEFSMGKIILSPLEAKPVEFQEIDFKTVANAYQASQVAERNAYIKYLNDRGIPATEENIRYVQTKRIADTSGNEYSPEFGPEGVYKGKPLSSGTGTSRKDQLQEIKLEQEIAANQRGVVRYGTVTVDPNTGKKTVTPKSGNKALEEYSPSNNPRLVSEDMDAKEAKLYDDEIAGRTKIIETCKIRIPETLRRYALQNAKETQGDANYFFKPDGTIDSEKLVNSEGAKREYIRMMFDITRDLGQGLGALSATDYNFIFTQTGIPVTIQEAVSENNGNAIDRAVKYLTKEYVQGKSGYFQNILDDLSHVSKRAIEENVVMKSNGKVQVFYTTNSENADGSSKPYESLKGSIAEAYDAFLKSGASDAQSAKLNSMLHKPEIYAADFGGSPNAARAYAIRRIAAKLNFSEQHVRQFTTKQN